MCVRCFQEEAKKKAKAKRAQEKAKLHALSMKKDKAWEKEDFGWMKKVPCIIR
jgi:hypothetical protein